jgi:hypothetical protein
MTASPSSGDTKIAPRDRSSEPARPRPSLLGTTIQVLTIALLLAILASVLLVLFSLASLASMPAQLTGGFGQRVGGLASEVSRTASGIQSAVQDATDPNRPPTGLSYDTELSSLQVWHTGASLPGSARYAVSLQSIQRRQAAATPDTAFYAVIHSELRQPNETRLLGQLIRSDADPHDYVAYKAETFQIAGALYRVNWISQAEAAMAVGTYRNPDAVNVPIKFEIQ